jgi:hypothetical protein
MDILRRLGLSLATLLFSLSIPILALLVSLYFIVSTSQPLKQALSTSGIYSVIAPDALAPQAQALSSLPLSDPGIKQAFTQALPPTFLQRSTEQIIDGTYPWVQGTSATPTFTVNLAPVKASFADNIAIYIQQKLAVLPACTQFIVPPTTVEDLLALTCMPRGYTAATIASYARQQAVDSKLFTDNNTIDASTFKDGQGNPITNQLSFIPALYHYYILSLYILPVLVLLCALAIIFWSTTKRAGIKRIAWLLITTGITSMVLAAVEVWLLDAGVTLLGTPVSGSPTIQDKVLLILETLGTDFRTWWFSIGAGYTVLGIILLIIVHFNRPRATLKMGGSQPYDQTSISPRMPMGHEK